MPLSRTGNKLNRNFKNKWQNLNAFSIRTKSTYYKVYLVGKREDILQDVLFPTISIHPISILGTLQDLVEGAVCNLHSTY